MGVSSFLAPRLGSLPPPLSAATLAAAELLSSFSPSSAYPRKMAGPPLSSGPISSFAASPSHPAKQVGFSTGEAGLFASDTEPRPLSPRRTPLPSERGGPGAEGIRSRSAHL